MTKPLLPHLKDRALHTIEGLTYFYDFHSPLSDDGKQYERARYKDGVPYDDFAEVRTKANEFHNLVYGISHVAGGHCQNPHIEWVADLLDTEMRLILEQSAHSYNNLAEWCVLSWKDNSGTYCAKCLNNSLWIRDIGEIACIRSLLTLIHDVARLDIENKRRPFANYKRADNQYWEQYFAETTTHEVGVAIDWSGLPSQYYQEAMPKGVDLRIMLDFKGF